MSRMRYSNSLKKEEKLLIGKIVRYFPKIGVVEVQIIANDVLKIGDEFGIIGAQTGIVRGKVEEMWVNEKPTLEAVQGDHLTLKIDKRVRDKDEFYVFRKKK